MGGKRGGGGGGLNRIGRMKKLNSLRLCSRWCQPVWPRQHLPLPSRTAFRPESKGNVTKAILKILGTPSRNDSTPDSGIPFIPAISHHATTTPRRRPQPINEQRLGLLFLSRNPSRKKDCLERHYSRNNFFYSYLFQRIFRNIYRRFARL